MKPLKSAIRAVLILLAVAVLWRVIMGIFRKLFHFPAPAFIGRGLDSDFRRAFQPASAVIERSGIREGMKVLEVGCGSGAYTTFVARAVGERGEVHALDVQPRMLAQLARKLGRAENADIRNVTLHEGSAYELPFDEDAFDLAYMITVLPEIPDQLRALREVKRVLKPGGILAVSEFLPDPDYPLQSTTVKWGREAGFEVEGVYGNVWTYTARFRRSIEL
jgi:ubiquinone/menaquinone biosynthesis C-methylase UbiE